MHAYRLLRTNRDFRNLWLASVGSQFGGWFNQVALAGVTLRLTQSPLAMGLVLLSGSLPAVILGPFAGPVVDRFRKKPLLIMSDLIRGLLALGFILAVLLHTSLFLYLNAALMSVASVAFGPARNATVPLVVNSDQLTTANTLESQAAGVIQILGAASGGIVAATVSPIACFVINAASYLWSAFLIMQCHWQESHVDRQHSYSYARAFQSGVREVTHNPMARAIVLIGISWGLAGGGYYVLIPILGQQTYHMGGFGIGVLYAIDGFGVMVGSLLVEYLVGVNYSRAVNWYGVAYVAQAVFFGVMTQFSTFLWGALMLWLMRVSSGVIIPLGTYLLQTSTATDIRGRVFALHSSTYGGVMQLSFAITGLAFAHFGIRAVGVGIGFMSLLSGLFWLVQFSFRSTGKP